ncbi:MAG: hypothetical protein DRI01_01755 [Chloroflexi bacterium]|nr:MAG: hypothetical protein DRI01_01755 [Chloroflexota bacterium]
MPVLRKNSIVVERSNLDKREKLAVITMKEFLLRGPIMVLICLAIGFAIVYGGGWLLQQLGWPGH